MSEKRIGTIIHGALGDCYEQICAIKVLKDKGKLGKWIGFFVDERQLKIMKHFDLSLLEEIYMIDQVNHVNVDEFFQFQIMDPELQCNVIAKFDNVLRNRFDFKNNIKPWDIIKKHNFSKNSLELKLSVGGLQYLSECEKINGVDQNVFLKKKTVGYLWRHRASNEAVDPFGQRTKEWILETKSALFRQLIKDYNAHIIIAGMGRKDSVSDLKNALDVSGFLPGEYKIKYTDSSLDLPQESCTYLKGIGYAAEIEIMSRCDLLLMMPSGFSEILWMKQKNPVLLLDSPPAYLLKLMRYRMPFFNNNKFNYFCFNNFTKHTARNVVFFIRGEGLL